MPQIHELIPKIMASVGPIAKDKFNSGQKYAFRGIDDVYSALHKPLAEHGVFYLPEVLSREVSERPTRSDGVSRFTVLTVAYTFFAPDGSSVRAVVVGEASDSGDKSANKAMSAALKYALLQIFCIPVEGQDDADAHSPELVAKNQSSAQPAREASNVRSISGEAIIDNTLTNDRAALIEEIESHLKRLDKPKKDLDGWISKQFEVTDGLDSINSDVNALQETVRMLRKIRPSVPMAVAK